MAKSPPRYLNDLSDFVADLRSLLFPSQRKAAIYFGVSRPTITRYEKGIHLPPLGYVACLVRLLVERQEEAEAVTYQEALFKEVNRAVRDYYLHDPPFQDWQDLCAVADEYLAHRRIADPLDEGADVSSADRSVIPLHLGSAFFIEALNDWVTHFFHWLEVSDRQPPSWTDRVIRLLLGMAMVAFVMGVGAFLFRFNNPTSPPTSTPGPLSDTITPVTPQPPESCATLSLGPPTVTPNSYNADAQAFAEPILAALADQCAYFADDFSGQQNFGWGLCGEDPTNGRLEIKDSVMRLSEFAPTNMVICNGLLTAKDFVLQLDTRMVQASLGSQRQVIFRYLDSDHTYGLYMRSPDQTWEVAKSWNGSTHFPRSEGQISPIGEVTHIIIVARGDQGAVYVNNVPAAYWQDADFNTIGRTTFQVEALSETIFEFDNVKFWNLDNRPTETPTPIPSSKLINDNFADALVIDNLPFTDSLKLKLATTEVGEPLLCSSGNEGDQFIDKHTVWYRFTPATTMGLFANMRSEFETSIIVYSGSSLNSLTRLGCVTSIGDGRRVIIPTAFIGGATYYLQVGGILGGNVDIRLERYLPSEMLTPMPSSKLTNDNFANTLVVDNLPYTDSLNLTWATTEMGEPLECSEGACVNHTVWYRFTPTTTTTLIFEGSSELSISITSYKGSSLNSIIRMETIIGGGQWNPSVVPTIFFSGTTYYLQVGGILGGNVDFQLKILEPTLTPTSLPPIITAADGAPMVLIPAGPFEMGSNQGESQERPVHEVTLAAFYINQYEVTNAQYRRCVEAGGCEQPECLERYEAETKKNHPVVCVSWNQAKKYCEWQKRRLPTEAEWEKAARGTDGRTYPWGDNPPDETLLNFDNNIGDTTPVGSYPNGVSPYGAYDMAGNVWEWTGSLWGKNVEKPDFSYPYVPTDGRENLEASSKIMRVLRGGSWLNSGHYARATARDYTDSPDGQSGHIGFRCAVAVP